MTPKEKAIKSARADEREKRKQEAIKWYHRSDGNKHKFIRDFFGITEEELKRQMKDETNQS